MLTILKGLPISYFKDLQDDKEIVFESYDNINNSIMILTEVINNLKPNKKRMIALANEGFTTATDFADHLVQKKNMSFRNAYKLSAKLVNYAEKRKKRLDQLTLNEVKKFKPDLDVSVLRIFNINNSVNSKSSYGGTAIKNVKKMIDKYKREMKI